LDAGAAFLVAGTYRRLPAPAEHRTPAATRPLARSRRIVVALSALFSLDSFGGGFVVQSLLVLWLFRRFALPVQVAGAIFFAAGLLAALFQFVPARPAARIGPLGPLGAHPLPPHRLPPAGGRADAQRAARGLLPAPATLALVHGRARAPGVRDGHGAARGARRRLERHQRPAQPCSVPLPSAVRDPARSNQLRLAAPLRRGAEGGLRPAALPAVRAPAPGRRA